MTRSFTVDFLWIPFDLGGHSSGPYDGMRLTIRWQKYIDEYLRKSNDVECKVLEFNNISLRGRLVCHAFSTVPLDWLSDGNLVEFVSGYKVISIGRICASDLV